MTPFLTPWVLQMEGGVHLSARFSGDSPGKSFGSSDMAALQDGSLHISAADSVALLILYNSRWLLFFARC